MTRYAFALTAAPPASSTRVQVLKLQAENEQLRIQEVEDRRRIQHLLALTQPVSQEVTFFRDCRPEQLTRQHGGSSAGQTQQRGKQPARASTSRVLRTVYLPSDRADALALKLDALQRQLASEQQAAEDRKRGAQAEAAAMEAAFKRKAAADDAQIKSLSEALETERSKLQQAVASHLRFKRSAQQQASQAAEAVAAAETAQKEAQQAAAETRAAATAEVEAITASTQADLKAARAYVQAQASAKADDVRSLQAAYDSTVAKYEHKCEELSSAVTQWKRKAARAEKQRRLALQGFTTDVATLRRALRQLETQWALVGQGVGNAAAGAWGFPEGVSEEGGSRAAAGGPTSYRPTYGTPAAGAHAVSLAPGLALGGATARRAAQAARAAPAPASTPVGVPPQRPRSKGGKRVATATTAQRQSVGTARWRPKSQPVLPVPEFRGAGSQGHHESKGGGAESTGSGSSDDTGVFVGASRAHDAVGESAAPSGLWDADRIQAELDRLTGRARSLQSDVAQLGVAPSEHWEDL